MVSQIPANYIHEKAYTESTFRSRLSDKIYNFGVSLIHFICRTTPEKPRGFWENRTSAGGGFAGGPLTGVNDARSSGQPFFKAYKAYLDHFTEHRTWKEFFFGYSTHIKPLNSSYRNTDFSSLPYSSEDIDKFLSEVWKAQAQNA